MTKKTVFGALALLFTIVGCAAGSEPEVDEPDHVDETEAALVTKTPTPFCLPGEVRKCTLGPPPVCRCVHVDPPVVYGVLAR